MVHDKLDFQELAIRVAKNTNDKVCLVQEITQLPDVSDLVCVFSYQINDDPKEKCGSFRRELLEQLDRAGVDEDISYWFSVACHELMANCYYHVPNRNGSCHVYQAGESLVFRIDDEGKGIPQSKLAHLQTLSEIAKTVDLKKEGGRGWGMAIEFLHKIYLCTGKKGTSIVGEVPL